MSNSTLLKDPGMEHTVDLESTPGLTNVTAELDALDNQDQQESSTGLFHLFRKYASLSDLLRYAGAVSVAVAMAMFLMDGAAQFTDLQRFLTMLGFTGALTAAGFGMSMLLKEQRGSRAFMMLSLLSVPVNFTVFGAMLYSFLPMDAVSSSYPGFALWQAGSADVVMALLAGMAVLLPVVWIGYSVLARTARGWLTASLFLSSAMLVMPVRGEFIIAALAILTTGSLWWFVRKNSKESLAFKTIEGKYSLALLFVPPIILIARSLYLYSAGGVLVLMLGAGAYLIIRQLLVAQDKSNFLTGVGTLLASVAAFTTSIAGADILHQMIGEGLAVAVATSGLLLLSHDLVNVSPSTRMAKSVGMLSVLLSSMFLVLMSLTNGSALVTGTCIAVLVAVAVYGHLQRYIAVTIVALLGTVAIIMTHIESMWSMALQTGWWGIAAIGAIAIVAGSVVDRVGTVVVPKSEAG